MLRGLLGHHRTGTVRPFNKIACGGNATSVRGLTKPLAATFYPYYKVTKKKSKFPYQNRSNSSTRLGIHVHKQIEQWVEGIQFKRPHSFTKQIQQKLHELKLFPLSPEAPLISCHGGYLTYSDLICYSRNALGQREIVVVSLKTGYNNGIEKSSGNCLLSCRNLPNCPKTHHILQVACEIYCLRHEYNIEVARGIVLYAGFGAKKKTAVLNLPSWAYNRALLADIHRDLLLSCPNHHKEVFRRILQTEQRRINSAQKLKE